MKTPKRHTTGKGLTSWKVNGILHREDGPAIEHPDGTKSWWINGKRHREDGPAIEYNDGEKYWFLNNKLVTVNSNEEFLRMVKLKAFW